MAKVGNRTSWTTYADRDAFSLDPASERAAGMMLCAFSARREDADLGRPASNEDGRVTDATPAGFPAVFDLSKLNGTNGVRINGVGGGDASGNVSDAGDVNGDGIDDIIIGAAAAESDGGKYAGESYVVFGRENGIPASFDLAALDGANGFRIDGIDEGDRAGGSVSSAGDINGDGFDDIIIGASDNVPGGEKSAGESYVVFGKAAGFGASLDLATLDGSNGFCIDGVGKYDRSGRSVSSAGDVNGDGFDDIIIGAPDADPGGESYVVFGKAGGFDASIALADLDGADGFRLEGTDSLGNSGWSVSSAGDVNDDGFDDIIIGAIGSAGSRESGESYLLFGRAPDEAVKRFGSAADQTIRGGAFDDVLRGLGGDDVLAGAGGHDRLRGGSGADEFLLASRDASDADRILDFGGSDRVALGGDVFGLAKGDLAPGRFAVGDAAGDANDRLIYDDATGQLFFDADGTGAQAQVLIAALEGAPTLAASDIVVL